jgi:hypothetical protein
MSTGDDWPPGQAPPEGPGPQSSPEAHSPAPELPAPAPAPAPSVTPPAVPPPPPPATWPSAPVPAHRGTGTYPIDIGVDVPERIARWRPFLQWILALPLYILLYVLSIVAGICAFIGWFVALFTGQLPEGLGNLIAGYYRLYWRTTTYASFLREKYPSFALSMGYTDPGDDPAWFDAQRPQKLSRLAVLFRIVLVIPQLIALLFVGIALYLVSIVAFFVVVIAGRWPSGLAEFVIGAHRWVLRVDGWFNLLADPYPPFSLT